MVATADAVGTGETFPPMVTNCCPEYEVLGVEIVTVVVFAVG